MDVRIELEGIAEGETDSGVRGVIPPSAEDETGSLCADEINQDVLDDAWARDVQENTLGARRDGAESRGGTKISSATS